MRREDQAPAVVDCQRLLTTAHDMLNGMKETIDVGVQAGEKFYFISICRLEKKIVFP